MKCKACDTILSDFESTVRSSTDGDFLDMCTRCLSYIREVISTSENFFLYNPELDDLDTQFDSGYDVALAALIGEFEDDAAAAVDTDGVRNTDRGSRDET